MAMAIRLLMGSKLPTTPALLYLVYEGDVEKDPILKEIDKKAQGYVFAKLNKREFKGKKGQKVSFENCAGYEAIYIAGLGAKEKFKPLTFKNEIANAVRGAGMRKIEALGVAFQKIGLDDFILGKIIAEGLTLGNYYFDKYKSAKDKAKYSQVKEAEVVGEKINALDFESGTKYGLLVADGVVLARDLVNEPASAKTPNDLVKVARDIVKNSKGSVSVQILGRAECEKLGMEAYLGVARGSDKEPQFIILHHKGSAKPKKTICVIGKSITFDSGGLSLKPASAMEDMKLDMAGGAAVLGVFSALSQLDDKVAQSFSDIEIYGILPACENMPFTNAQKPGDIVRAMNGKTIEVLNTDAEGRLALADALSYAEAHIKPDIMIDLATLTGACMVALGTDLAGLFGTDNTLVKNYQDVANQEGDHVWPLPLYKPYAKLMKSDIADLKNISKAGYGGAITAAVFLKEFVNHAKWIHVDIAGPSFHKGAVGGILSGGATGWGVASVLEFVRTIK